MFILLLFFFFFKHLSLNSSCWYLKTLWEERDYCGAALLYRVRLYTGWLLQCICVPAVECIKERTGVLILNNGATGYAEHKVALFSGICFYKSDTLISQLRY